MSVCKNSSGKAKAKYWNYKKKIHRGVSGSYFRNLAFKDRPISERGECQRMSRAPSTRNADLHAKVLTGNRSFDKQITSNH